MSWKVFEWKSTRAFEVQSGRLVFLPTVIFVTFPAAVLFNLLLERLMTKALTKQSLAFGSGQFLGFVGGYEGVVFVVVLTRTVRLILASRE